MYYKLIIPKAYICFTSQMLIHYVCRGNILMKYTLNRIYNYTFITNFYWHYFMPTLLLCILYKVNRFSPFKITLCKNIVDTD